jgi:hypothetical protein
MFTDSTQTGEFREYIDISIQTFHRQKYINITQTEVYRQYTNRTIQTVHSQD